MGPGVVKGSSPGRLEGVRPSPAPPHLRGRRGTDSALRLPSLPSRRCRVRPASPLTGVSASTGGKKAGVRAEKQPGPRGRCWPWVPAAGGEGGGCPGVRLNRRGQSSEEL